ncbi:MAG: N-acetyl-gamma-glutamyl-phosphate reductase [Candidatus Planktophila sp.]
MKIGLIGGSGYAGGELLRLLANHPRFDVVAISAHSNAGEEITSIHPQLHSYSGRKFSSFSPEEFSQCELVFFALPHGESSKLMVQLPQTVKIVDLGADYRLKSEDSWKKYYGGDYAGSWVYGIADLPGKSAEIAQSSRVANPGCYATSIALGAAPASAFADLSDVVVVAASGTTGAGRTAKINLIASEVAGSLSSYKFGGIHQHTPEIEETLASISGQSVKVSFTPILAPMPRGILSTITVKLNQTISIEQVRDAYAHYYQESPFVTLLPEGQMPKTSSVLGSNLAQLQVAIDAHTNRLVISVAIDNLGKGAAAQALHNANLIAGFAATDGLLGNGLGA